MTVPTSHWDRASPETIRKTDGARGAAAQMHAPKPVCQAETHRTVPMTLGGASRRSPGRPGSELPLSGKAYRMPDHPPRAPAPAPGRPRPYIPTPTLLLATSSPARPTHALTALGLPYVTTSAVSASWSSASGTDLMAPCRESEWIFNGVRVPGGRGRSVFGRFKLQASS
jgi:hypothetical protein